MVFGSLTLHLQVNNVGLSLSHATISLVLSFLPSFARMDPWDDAGSICAIQD